MLIHNASFMIEQRRAEEFIDWVYPLAGKAAGEHVWRLSLMRRAAGGDASGEHAMCVAWQVEFPSLEEIDGWIEKRFNILVASFERRFGPEAMVFTSVFEEIVKK